MLIRVLRTSENNKSTTGEIHVDGTFVCHSLELPWRNNQSYVSSIPVGTYPAHLRYDKADGWRIQLDDVPGRTGVQFHVGNYPSQIEGCILTGEKVVNSANRLDDSAAAYARLKRAFYGTDNPTSTPDIDLHVEIAYQPARTTFSTSAPKQPKYVYQKQAYWEEQQPGQGPNALTEVLRDLSYIHLKFASAPVQLRIPLFGGKLESKWGSDPWETGDHDYTRSN